MSNPFTRLRSWFTANRKYDGFVAFVAFGFGTIFMLVGNILADTTPLDWAIWIIWLQTVLYSAASWQKDKHLHNLFEFYKELLRHAHESEYAAIENSEQYHRWLVSANRRRKRAERKLKNTRLALRKESAERFGFELQCGEYEAVLLDANLAMADISSCPILPDTKAMAEAQQRFKSYMKIHYAEIAKRQLNRELKKSAFGCLFFGDANGDPKDVYAGIFCGEEIPSTENKETKQQ